MAWVASAVAALLVELLVRLPRRDAGRGSSSSHSRAPSSLVHCAGAFGRGAPRRRSRSSASSRGRSSVLRLLTWCAPRRATLPQPAALRGSGGRSSRGARGGPSFRVRSSAGRRRGAPARGGPERAAPVRGAPERGAPDRGAPDRGAPDRGAPVLEAPAPVPVVRLVPEDLGRPVWPALLPGARRCDPAPPVRPEPVPLPVRSPPAPRVPVPLRDPPGLAGRRAGPPPAPLREEGRPAPLRLP
jgi:hypothetical protein